MVPALHIGRFVLPTVPLIFIIGAWVALGLTERIARVWAAAQAERIYQLASWGLLVGIIGARLFFVAAHWSAYRHNMWGIMWPITTGFNSWAGLILGLVTAFFYGRYHQLNAANTLDVLMPGLLVGLMALSLADFLAGPGFGTPTNLPWAIGLFGLKRHPVQLYEIGVGLAALLAWWRTGQRRQFMGQQFLTAGTVYSIGRLWIDAFRENAPVTADGYHIIQIISLAFLLTSLWLLSRQMPVTVAAE